MNPILLLKEVDLTHFRVIDCPVTVIDLWNAVRLVLAGRTDGQIQGSDSLELNSVPAALTYEFSVDFANDLDSKIEIRFEDELYQITFESGNTHNEGHGGHSEGITRLLRDEAVVLVARQQIFYSTSSDDAEDFTSIRKDELILVDDADKLAELVFALLASS